MRSISIIRLLERKYAKSNIFYNISDEFVDKPQRENRKKNHLNIDRENLFGIDSIYSALKAQKRIFYKLYIRDSLYYTVINNNNNASNNVNHNIDHVNKYIDDMNNNCDNMNYNENSIYTNVNQLKLSEIIKLSKSINIPIVLTPSADESRLNDRSNSLSHDGVVVECSQLPSIEIGRCVLSENDNSSFVLDTLVCLDEVKDRMNLANALIACRQLGVSGLLLPGDRSGAPCPLVSRISHGAMEVVPIYRMRDKVETLRKLRETGWVIVGTDGTSKCDERTRVIGGDLDQRYVDMIRNRGVVLVMGGEGAGMTAVTRYLCDLILTISSPDDRNALIDCLNVSTALGIILHYLFCIKNPEK